MINEKELCRKYVGVPYEHHGRTIEGLDCWGLPIMAYKDALGVDLPDLENYDYNWFRKGKDYFSKKYYIENYYKFWKKVDDYQYLDLVMFKNAQGVPHHAGIYLSENRFLQCALKVGVIISPLNELWREKMRGVYRYTPQGDGEKDD